MFKPLRTKAKEYVFKYAGNEKLKSPARVVFAHFPMPDENFIKSEADIRYADVDFEKVGRRDVKELQKLFEAFKNNIFDGSALNFPRVDVPAFLQGCVERFENLAVDEAGKKRKIETVDDFLTLPEAAVYDISKDLYFYAKEKDDFTMGEGRA